MAILDDATKVQVKEILTKMDSDVDVLFFDKAGTQYGSEVNGLLTELSELNDHIKLKILDENSPEKEKYKVDKFPATVLVGKNKGLIRFFGIPSGYEFATLLEDLVMTSTGHVDLPDSVIDFAKSINDDLNLKVFITPTCPYCPRSVKLAHELAMFNEKISGDMIEAMEFEELSTKFKVSGVPHTVVNDGKSEYVGAYPPDAAVGEIKKAL